MTIDVASPEAGVIQKVNIYKWNNVVFSSVALHGIGGSDLYVHL